MKRLMTALFSLGIACSLGFTAVAYADVPQLDMQAAIAPAATSGDITVVRDGRTSTYSDIQSALNVANDDSSTSTVNITLAKDATYVVDGKLYIYSHTTLDLNGATIKRSDAGIDDGIIYNYPIGWRGSRGVQRNDAAAGGYNMSQDITVKNGTLDGGDISKATNASVLLRFDHASGIAVSKVNFRNVYDCHHLAFVGVKDGTVSDCTFTGFRYQKGKENEVEYGREAFEFDGAWTNNPSDLSDKKSMWSKDTYLDMTTNQDCVVERCTFTDVPSAVGGHHWSSSAGFANSNNVVIRNNTIVAPASRTYYKTAITGGGIDNLKVLDNTVIGPYVFSIHAYRGTDITISGNTFDGGRKNAVMVDGSASGVVIDGNTIVHAAQHAISIIGCSVTSVSNNTITSPKANGITVSSGSVATIKGNALNGVGKNAISVVGGTVGVKGKASTGIVSNKINKTSSGNAITVSRNATVVNVNGNKISNPKKSGISVIGKAKVSTIKSNTITKKAGKYGIYLGSKKLKAKVQKNKVTVCLEKYGIGIGSGAKPKLSGNKVIVKK